MKAFYSAYYDEPLLSYLDIPENKINAVKCEYRATESEIIDELTPYALAYDKKQRRY